MFSVQNTAEELKNATIAARFGFVFEENSVGKSRYYRDEKKKKKLRFTWRIQIPSV